MLILMTLNRHIFAGYVLCWCRNRRLEVFYEKGALKNLTKFVGKQLCRSLYLIKRYFFHRTHPVAASMNVLKIKTFIAQNRTFWCLYE